MNQRLDNGVYEETAVKLAYTLRGSHSITHLFGKPTTTHCPIFLAFYCKGWKTAGRKQYTGGILSAMLRVKLTSVSFSPWLR
jgi:hypothetical protein